MRSVTVLWRAVDAIWRVFVSLRLTLGLLIALGLAMALGTFLPQLPQQGMSSAQLELLYPGWLLEGLRLFQAFDLFHSWWFSTLLMALCLNLLACSLSRIPELLRVLRAAAPGEPPPSASSFTAPGTAVARLSRAFVEGARAGPEEWRVAERGRVGRLSFLAVHAGLGLVLIGGAWSQLSGREGSLVLAPGEQGEELVVRRSDGRLERTRLPFSLRCRDFFMERHGAGMAGVRDYVSLLEVVEAGRVVRSQRLEVNTPLSHGGFSFYQTSFQRAPDRDRALLGIRDRAGERRIEAGPGTCVAEGPDGSRHFLDSLREDFQGLGEAVRIRSQLADGRERSYWVLGRYPGFAQRNRPGGAGIDLLEARPGHATILGVTRDPSPPLVYLGALLLCAGLVLVFFVRHRRIWWRVRGQELEVACWSHRAQAAFASGMRSRLGLGERADGEGEG
ncbi:MAG: cytochrome c biogenesis protein ResB [Deltaproteobacteria bacterium]|nr:cytochrome c biogenesis protein ResB [Deltaproteobacteria bacterium]